MFLFRQIDEHSFKLIVIRNQLNLPCRIHKKQPNSDILFRSWLKLKNNNNCLNNKYLFSLI